MKQIHDNIKHNEERFDIIEWILHFANYDDLIQLKLLIEQELATFKDEDTIN